MLHSDTKCGQDWPSSSWEEVVNGWRTTVDDGLQAIAIGHLSDSGDLNNDHATCIFFIIIIVSFLS